MVLILLDEKVDRPGRDDILFPDADGMAVASLD